MNRVKRRVEQILNRLEKLGKYVSEVNQLNAELTSIQLRGCNHKHAYWLGTQSEDEFEGRRYDNIYCPDCHFIFEERCYGGEHKYPTRGEQLERLKEEANNASNSNRDN